MPRRKKRAMKRARSIMVRDMILTRKGGPHSTRAQEVHWDEEDWEFEDLNDDDFYTDESGCD